MSFVASDLSMRMWRVHKASGRPFPALDSDEVIDYLIIEALSARSAKEEAAAAKNTEVEDWKKNTEELEQYRG